MIPSDLLTLLAGELGVGGVGGFCVGYALKKIVKILAIFTALSVAGLQYLANEKIISLNYGAFQDWIMNLLTKTSGLEGIATKLITQSSFGVGFIGGFYLGLKNG